jgi:hypothetical protein
MIIAAAITGSVVVVVANRVTPITAGPNILQTLETIIGRTLAMKFKVKIISILRAQVFERLCRTFRSSKSEEFRRSGAGAFANRSADGNLRTTPLPAWSGRGSPRASP